MIEGIRDGTIDCIATDHAPHSAEEKSRGLLGSMMGIVGLETAFPVLYTKLVKESAVISLERLIELMSINPDKIFGFNKNNDWAIIDLGANYKIDPEHFHTMGRASPFSGWSAWGKNIMTIKDGKEIWRLTER